MFAEDLLTLLAQKNLVSPELLRELRMRIAQTPESVSAEAFAERLVENGVLTASLADALIRQLQNTGDAETSLAPPPLPQQQPQQREISLPQIPAPPPAPLAASAAPIPPMPPASSPFPTQATNYDQFRLKRFSHKKKAANPWDSKLVLFGGGSLLVLLLIGLFLSGSLFRRNADAMLATANEAYGNGSYSPAILAYTEFLNTFPNHSGASTAQIRRALARIRLAVDSKTDGINAYETAEAEIESIRREPNFFDESKSELAVLLPKIASGLAEEAQKKNSILHAEHAEKTLTLMDKVLPKSLQPTEKRAEIQFRIDRVRRLLVQGDILDEIEKELKEKLAVDHFDVPQVERCFDLVNTVLVENPELETDDKYRNLLQELSENEHRAVVPLSAEQIPKGIAKPTEEAAKVHELAILYYRTKNKEVVLEENPPVYLYAAGAVFGLQSSDGLPLWKRTVGLTAPSASSCVVPVPKTSKSPKPSVLVVDSRTWSLDRWDGHSGEILWRLPIGEPFYLSEVVADAEQACIAVATQSGKLLFLALSDPDAGHSNPVWGVQLPQKISSAPMIGPVNKLLFQLGDRHTLFVLPFENKGEISKQASSFFIGQKPSTIRVPPVLFGDNILIVQQKDQKTCEMLVFSPKKGVLQTIPIRGMVDAPPFAEGNYLVLISDSGETMLFEQSDDAKEPLRKIAAGSAGENSPHQGIVRYATLIGKNVWVADRQLMRFETQLVQSRLLPGNIVQKDIITLAPPYRIGNVLFLTFRNPGIGGVFLAAISLEQSSLLWETELAEPIVLEPKPDEAQNLLLYTSSGKAYQIKSEETETFQGTPATMLSRGAFALASLGDVISLHDGFSAWIPQEKQPGASSNVTIFDPTASEATRFRLMILPDSMSSPPIAFDGHLLVPLSGVKSQVVLLDPKSGNSAASPFIPSMTLGKKYDWGSPVALPDSKEFLIIDNAADENGNFRLFRVAMESEKLVAKKSIPLDQPVSASIAVSKNKAVLIDNNNVLHIIRLDTTELEKSESLSAPCLWGPYSLNDAFFWATSDGKLCMLSADSKLVSVTSPIPVGKPLEDNDGIILVSASGTLWKVDSKDLKEEFRTETFIRTTVGPIRSGNRIVLAGQDGTVVEVRP